MLEGIIFDFDGVVIDTEYEWYPIIMDWFKKTHDYDLLMEEYLMCIGSNSNKMLKIVSEKIGTEITMDDYHDAIFPTFKENTQKLPAMAGVEALMKDAKAKGLKIAIATSSPRNHPLTHLKRLDLLEYVDVIVGGDEVENIKPEPDLFNRAQQLLGIDKNKLIIFEDSLNGLHAGVKAGIDVIVVPNRITKHLKFEGHHDMIESLDHFDFETYL